MCPCVHDKCKPGGALEVDCDPCVTKVCDQYPTCCATAWGAACVTQVAKICTESCGGAVCGNSNCEPGEDCKSCPADCGACPTQCGNLACEPGEDCMSCPGDCGVCPVACGNGTCDSDEDCKSCPDDCGPCPAECGNGACESGEDCGNCPSDCGTCPVCHDLCMAGAPLDPACDSCVDFVCNEFGDTYCCSDAWDPSCVYEAAFYCSACQ